MSDTIKIPDEVLKIMSYLSVDFARSMNDTVNSKEDLYNDMVVLYLENIDSGKVKDVSDKNQWFIFLKSRMIDKYKKLMGNRNMLKKVSEERRY